MLFQLRDQHTREHLLAELDRHDGVTALADDVDGRVLLRVTVPDMTPAAWDARAAVYMYDDRAVLLSECPERE